MSALLLFTKYYPLEVFSEGPISTIVFADKILPILKSLLDVCIIPRLKILKVCTQSHECSQVKYRRPL